MKEFSMKCRGQFDRVRYDLFLNFKQPPINSQIIHALVNQHLQGQIRKQGEQYINYVNDGSSLDVLAEGKEGF